MTIKEKILIDLKEIAHPKALYQIFDFINLIKKNTPSPQSNVATALACAGTVSLEQADAIKSDIDETFNHIEGDW